MLRKLFLSGLLQFVSRGTAAQVLAGCTLSVTALCYQMYLCPYVNSEANLLKTLAEIVIFFTFLIAFILRVLPHVQDYEPLAATFYGNLLLAIVGAFMVIAISLTTRQIMRRCVVITLSNTTISMSMYRPPTDSVCTNMRCCARFMTLLTLLLWRVKSVCDAVMMVAL